MKCTSQIVSNCTGWFYGICSYWSKTQISDISTLAIVKCCCHVIGSVYLSSSFQIAMSWVSGLSSIFINSWLELLALLFKTQDELMLHYAPFREAWPQLLSLSLGLLVLGFSRRRLEFLQKGGIHPFAYIKREVFCWCSQILQDCFIPLEAWKKIDLWCGEQIHPRFPQPQMHMSLRCTYKQNVQWKNGYSCS